MWSHVAVAEQHGWLRRHARVRRREIGTCPAAGAVTPYLIAKRLIAKRLIEKL
jgi:hypothetical protein